MSHKKVSNARHYREHTREQDGWTVLAPPPAVGDDLPPLYTQAVNGVELGGAEGVTRRTHGQTRSPAVVVQSGQGVKDDPNSRYEWCCSKIVRRESTAHIWGWKSITNGEDGKQEGETLPNKRGIS
ncbi:hypothetical protein B0H17DRAFT_1141011 [Mycena rosella]|uniref:Uncharacterized protein n=1 Tax=Mycena rosella TaxID=1033263 RepID=A0AAD7D126_MYCRO|nr:hypothetical protein B0H17DRAFT_1141011 [Mycena rosella]